uniref:Uncharacterized protein n=1 Tax=Globodera rostochiensis TaxID=31243 RepID=A0A914H870_GLORO
MIPTLFGLVRAPNRAGTERAGAQSWCSDVALRHSKAGTSGVAVPQTLMPDATKEKEKLQLAHMACYER